MEEKNLNTAAHVKKKKSPNKNTSPDFNYFIRQFCIHVDRNTTYV